MSYILALETATKICSVALFKDEHLLLKKEEGGEYSHAEKLGPFIEEVLKSCNVSYKQLSAVAVSKGPGSYTGLRIGTSTAKGLCYALEIPFISVSTLEAMAYLLQKQENIKEDLISPMIDARRMEVYTSVFKSDLSVVEPISAKIIDETSFAKHLENHKTWFFGDGADKTTAFLKQHKNAIFSAKGMPSAEGIGFLAYQKFKSSQFEDLAYFEPFYLKDFVAVPAKKLL